MVAQYYDNVWVYTKDITQKYNADNRLDYGISKDLVSDAIKDFGVKLYQNNFSQDDLYTAFLGLTPSGSLFPFPEITSSLPTPTGFEYVDTLISASTDVIPLDDVNKSLYKRLYHNIPYLLKSKGTIPGLRALITSYGIPDTILRISEFGGKDKADTNDYDYYFNKFNYSFSTSGSNNIRSPWEVNPFWGSVSNRPSSLELRFKTEDFPPTNLSQSLWSLYSSSTNLIDLTLEYSNSGLSSGSYNGSIKDPYYQYANLKFYPSASDTTTTASVYLPFFNGDWWSVMVTSGSNGYELFAKNKIYNGKDGTQLGYQSSSIVSTVDFSGTDQWSNALTSSFATSSLFPGFSGSLQEIRYYKNALSESVFNDYVMNPLSIEGNTINSSPDELIFRAPLGSELNNSLTLIGTSIHPKVTGSWVTTSSFCSASSGTILTSSKYARDAKQIDGPDPNQRNWSDISNSTNSPDGSGAFSTGSVVGLTYTHELYTNTYDFSIPDSSSIEGIVVTITKKVNLVDENTSVISDSILQLMSGSEFSSATAVGDNKGNPSLNVWTTSYSDYTYGSCGGGGSSPDTWGRTWTPEEINANGFGVRIRAQIAATPTFGDGNVTASIDAVGIKVCYTSASISCTDNKYYFYNTASFVPNTEYYFLDQPIAGIKNRITDKVRYENNVVPTGDTLSPFRRVTQQTEASASYTENINLLESAFSPQNEINDDIIGQLGYFNLGDYIGDPRQRSSSLDYYPDLNNLSEDYFEKYIKNYDLVDFVRLIKFFDNSLFKMIKDFIPARTSLASGLLIKQHLLERNKYPQPQLDIDTCVAKYPLIQSISKWIPNSTTSSISSSKYPNTAAQSGSTYVAGVPTAERSWINVDNITGSYDGYVAYVQMNPGYDTRKNSKWLLPSNYELNIPPLATIDGIEVEVKVNKIESLSATTTAYDKGLYLVKDITDTGSYGLGDNKASPATATYAIPDSSAGWKTGSYGSPSSSWGQTWTPAEINSTNFGAQYQVQYTGSGGGNVKIRVDSVLFKVYYSGDIGTYVSSSTHTLKCISKQNTAISGTVAPQWNDYNSGSISNLVGGTGGNVEPYNLPPKIASFTFTGLFTSSFETNPSKSGCGGSGSVGINPDQPDYTYLYGWLGPPWVNSAAGCNVTAGSSAVTLNAKSNADVDGFTDFLNIQDFGLDIPGSATNLKIKL